MKLFIRKNLLFIFTSIFLFSCASSSNVSSENLENSATNLVQNPSLPIENIVQKNDVLNDEKTISLLFAGDIMAHSVNFNMKDYNKIWTDVKDVISAADLSFANLEAPVDSTKKAQSYPNFNMPISYVRACVESGFDVFSLCNNHSNDQGKSGISETLTSLSKIRDEQLINDNLIYFSGLKVKETESFTYNIIHKNGFKIVFLPITEILNRPDSKEFINYVAPVKEKRNQFINFCKNLKQKEKCDLFILSVHANDTEYTRDVTENQEKWYMQLLDCGIDIIWANHAHIIKDRKIVIDKNGAQKIIMYANGNTISGQRTNPNFTEKNVDLERDNTGDGLLYLVELKKSPNKIQIKKITPIFITTYINTAWEFVVKKLDDNFINYLKGVPRKNWADYMEKRKKLNEKITKDIIVWQ